MGRRVFKPTPRVLGALASPLRQDILVVLENSGPTSVAELARRIGRRPDALYHHLRVLERVEMVRQAGGGPTGGRPGSVWRVTAHPIQVRAEHDAAPPAPLADRVVGALTRAGARDFGRAFRRHLARRGPRPDAMRYCVWLDGREHARMRQALEALIRRFQSYEPRAGRSPFILTCLVAAVADPLPGPPARRRARAVAGSRATSSARRRAPSARARARRG